MLRLHHQTSPGTSDLSALHISSELYLATAEITTLSLSVFSFVALPFANSSLLQTPSRNFAHWLQSCAHRQDPVRSGTAGNGIFAKLDKDTLWKWQPFYLREQKQLSSGAGKGGSWKRFCSIFQYFPLEQTEWNQGAIMPCDFGQWSPLKLWGNSLHFKKKWQPNQTPQPHF